ncbi:M56 family metallopeptidase [Planctomicrobium sp.]|nr:M56 family metallopeptidase [Planctomicrobium sp.]MDB4743586.1 M56 family metallopeptidase [Planctomicrobium sp.]
MNSNFTTIFWTQFWQISLLIPAAVLLIRYIVPKSPHLGYGILLLVLIKTIFPPIWDSPTGIVWELLPNFELTSTSEEVTGPVSITEKSNIESHLQTSSGTIGGSPIQATPLVESRDSIQRSKGHSLNSKVILIGIWLAGVLSLLGYIIGKRAQLFRFHRDTEIPPSDELLELVEVVSAELALVKTPKVLVTLHPTVPFASGFFKQVVVLPAHVAENTDSQELKLILAHEMTHLRRGDTLVGLLQLIVQVLWWFHPLVYWLNREVRRVREECCDSDVVRRLNCQPARYAHCLLNMLELHRQLRPSAELVGLSPLEVTKKRMQNIMRTSSRGKNKISAVASSLFLVVFALLTLPASANSFVTPKVILGDLVPQDAMVVQKSKLPPVKKNRESPKTNKNKKTENKTDDTAVQTTEEQESPSVKYAPNLEPQELTANLEYQWERGNKYRYRVKIEAKHPTEIVSYVGEPTFRVDAYAAGIPALSRTNIEFEKSVNPIAGVELPTLSSLENEQDFSSPFSYPSRSRIPFGPPGTNSSQPSKPTGSNAHIDPSTGSLPYLLGQLQDWVFPALPASLDKMTQIDIQKEFTLTSPGHFSLSPFESAPQLKLLANVEIQTSHSAVHEKEISIRRSWKLSSQELINGEATRELSLAGEFQLDRSDSFPNSASFSGKLVEREFNREYRIPLTIEIRRLR